MEMYIERDIYTCRCLWSETHVHGDALELRMLRSNGDTESDTKGDGPETRVGQGGFRQYNPPTR